MRPASTPERATYALGLALFALGQGLALFWVPPERMMGEVGRILYVHVPAAWLSLVAYTIAFGAALGFLFTGRRSFEHTSRASAEAGTVLNGLLLALGALFARPTWGVWWTWDPRLTASAIMFLTFAGVILLRSAVHDPERRATWSAIATVLAYVNIPITYFSVQMWRSIHQAQSNPGTMDGDMVLVLRLNAFAFLFLLLGAIATGRRLSEAADARELAPPLETP